jgi:hypothetical protein
MELYYVLRAAGVEDDKARAAAAAVLDTGARAELATKTDVAEFRQATKAYLHEMEARIIKWNVGAIIAMPAVFVAIVKLLPAFAVLH